MKYYGEYFGVDKYVIVFWNKKDNDFDEIWEEFTLDTSMSELKHYVHLLSQEYPDKDIRVLKETWQGNDWSDYETIELDWSTL